MKNSVHSAISSGGGGIGPPADGGALVGSEGVGVPSGSWYEKIWPRLDAGPVAAVMVDLIDWLVARGYAPTTQRNIVRAAARLGSWMVTDGVGLDELDAACVAGMVRSDNERHPQHRSANENVSAVVGFLRETGRLRPVSVPPERLSPAQTCLARWLRFLEVEQGQGVSWIGKARRVGDAFLALIEDRSGRLCWERVGVAMVNAFLGGAVTGYSSSTAQCTAALLRGLLGWAADQGWIRPQIVSGVLSPRRVRTGVPEGLTTGNVTALKNAIDLRSRTGRRDMAIIVMLTRLGMRAGEVAGLRLDDINWRGPSIRVVGKNGRVLMLPMPVDVGETLVAYLRVRSADPGERGVFIRSLSPLRALGRTGISNIVSTHAHTAGLQGVHAHLLRHTAARQVLAGGGTLRQVQELLGHAQAASSVTYARVDMTPLRPLAPSWGTLP